MNLEQTIERIQRKCDEKGITIAEMLNSKTLNFDYKINFDYEIF